MINFPVFDELKVEGYGLFPGEGEGEPGLHIQFQPGLTLILGSNGLGKTTLVTILYRMLAGPADIAGLSGRAELGYISLQATPLSSSARAAFARRVSDGARSASAKLRFSLGTHRIFVERRISNLALISFSVNDQDLSKEGEACFQTEIPKLVGLWSFGDWVLLLRHLVFYFEDRRALVWDPSAQRQILRFLLLPPQVARKWTQDEREILELDSRARNLSASVYREEQDLGATEIKIEKSADVHAELETLEGLQQVDTTQRETLDGEFVEFDASRQAARLRLLKAEQEREARYRDLERAKLTAVESRFPRQSETARYILAQLMSDGDCLACGNHVPAAAAELEKRIERQRCVVCDSGAARVPIQGCGYQGRTCRR